MTKRNTQFTATQNKVLPTSQPTKTSTETPNENPLAAFFRKPKFSILLPSKGNWYSEGSLTLDEDGRLPIFPMNAADDIKFRTGDATLTGKNIYDVIKSCAPGLTEPELIPYLDADAILLAIRFASYGDEFDFNIQVPNTKLTRKVKFSATKILQSIANKVDTWDEEINIIDDNNQTLALEVHPLPLSKIFEASKAMFSQQKAMARNLDVNSNVTNDNEFSNSVNAIASSAIDLFCSCIKKLKIVDAKNNVLIELDATNVSDAAQIGSAIRNLDIAYFNSIRDHIDTQRRKYIIFSPVLESTEEEKKAGAPDTWQAELSFMSSNFLPESKSSAI